LASVLKNEIGKPRTNFRNIRVQKIIIKCKIGVKYACNNSYIVFVAVGNPVGPIKNRKFDVNKSPTEIQLRQGIMLGRPFWAIAVTLLNLRSPWLNGDAKSGKK
jgi:hypothetical protein